MEHKYDEFFALLRKRYQVFINKEAKLPKPWTDDPILLDYRFCNVFREDDTVTIWIRENWREPYFDHPKLWFAMCVARQINHPETLAELTDLVFSDKDWWDDGLWRIATDRMEARMARGEKVYTGAYMIRGPVFESDRVKSKAEHTCKNVLAPVWIAGRSDGESEFGPTTIQGCTNWLSQFHGWGGFMSYEVATDLRHTRYLQNAADITLYANPGPGAARGLSRIYERDLDQAVPKQQQIDEMWELMMLSIHGWTKPMGDQVPVHKKHLEMRDIEHGLCEFDKYERVRLGQGRPRSRYPGRV